MHVQEKKPKKNKSRSFSNTFIQQKSGVKQVFGFADNRPESIAQRKMEVNGKGVIQRALNDKFVPEKFNVAGETHAKVDRNAELKFLEGKAIPETPYYEEHELRMDGTKAVQSESEKGKAAPADPVLLRILQAATLMEEKVFNIEKSMTEILTLNPTLQDADPETIGYRAEQRIRGEALGVLLSIYDTLHNAIPQLMIQYIEVFNTGNTAREVDAEPTKEFEVEIVKKYRIPVKTNVLLPLAKMLQGKIDRESFYANVSMLRLLIKKIIRDLFDLTLVRGGIRSGKEGARPNRADLVTASRSAYMHETANELNEQGKLGLWKIGDSHVADIIRNETASEIDYNLMTEEDFQRGIKN